MFRQLRTSFNFGHTFGNSGNPDATAPYDSNKEGKDQESIQSRTTPDPGYQWESDNITIRHKNESTKVSPFPAGDHKASTYRRA